MKIRKQLDRLLAGGERIPLALYMMIDLLAPIEEEIGMFFERNDEDGNVVLIIYVNNSNPESIAMFEDVFKDWSYHQIGQDMALGGWCMEFDLGRQDP